jgi:hypothetical protein
MLRVFQSKVLRRIFGPKWDEVTEEWKEIYNEELNELYSSLNSIWVIKSRKIRWGGFSRYRGEEKCTQGLDGET